jgi:putative tryptophan/tyrosine transport system substrate-binding protein
LARQNIHVLVTYSNPSILAAKQVTATIPIVMAVSADAVTSGQVASLNRSGNNVTGQTWFTPEVNAKRIELLREVMPQNTLIFVLFNPDNTNAGAVLKNMASTAISLNSDGGTLVHQYCLEDILDNFKFRNSTNCL